MWTSFAAPNLGLPGGRSFPVPPPGRSQVVQAQVAGWPREGSSGPSMTPTRSASQLSRHRSAPSGWRRGSERVLTAAHCFPFQASRIPGAGAADLRPAAWVTIGSPGAVGGRSPGPRLPCGSRPSHFGPALPAAALEEGGAGPPGSVSASGTGRAADGGRAEGTLGQGLGVAV